MITLPIDSILPDLLRALDTAPNVVLEAPPGAGKTTKVPLALLQADWLKGQRIIMLEPRRLAARAAAARMADLLGEEVGARVGYRIRMEKKIGPSTQIEVVTEGILTRLLQDDPALDGIGIIIFDEFHERSLHADLGLALTLDCQKGLREDLRILVMSATLDGEALSKLLDDAPIVKSAGKSYPVETSYLGKPARGELELKTVNAIKKALAEESGSILTFLPGEREIKRVESMLRESNLADDTLIAPLYGVLSQRAQDVAIKASAKGIRKIVLSSAIAETSLTIDGVRVVIDAGLSRKASFNAPTGMTKLETIPVAKSSADQRRGRAGRLEAGVCYRLWEKAAHGGLQAYPAPEILEADLAPLVLELALWGIKDPGDLTWATSPPPKSYNQAVELLFNLEALDANRLITKLGKKMATLGMHPRLAHMTLRAKEMGDGPLACLIAALLSERDFLNTKGQSSDADIRTRLELMAAKSARAPNGFQLRRGAFTRAIQSAENWQRRLGLTKDGTPPNFQRAGIILALAYPDRIAQRRPGNQSRYLLSNATGACIHEGDPLASEKYLAVTELGGHGIEPRIFFAAPVQSYEIEEVFGASITHEAGIKWDKKTDSVLAQSQDKLGALILSSKPLNNPDLESITDALIEGIRHKGLQVLPWTVEATNLRQRLLFLRQHEDTNNWPDLTDNGLLDELSNWLAPYLNGVTRFSQLANIDLEMILKNTLDWNQQQLLEKLAPTHIRVPSGSNIHINYKDVAAPILPVKLQEMFGATATPSILNGKFPLTLHLLSPAQKPLQITQDLPAFWANAYNHVKSEMKGRYPKHPWPDDPTTAFATGKTKRHLNKMPD